MCHIEQQRFFRSPRLLIYGTIGLWLLRPSKETLCISNATQRSGDISSGTPLDRLVALLQNVSVPHSSIHYKNS